MYVFSYDLSFCAMAFIGFLLLCKGTFFTLSHFFLTVIDIQRFLHLALGLVAMHSAAAISVVTVFLFS